MGETRERPVHELLSHTLVDIYIGRTSTRYPLHEKLLCHHSPVFRRVFYDEKSSSSSPKSYGLPDDDEDTFALLVAWLYSGRYPRPQEEKDVGPLLDLYLLADKLEIEALSTDVVATVREFFHTSGTYPGLRRVQYVYANTEDDNELREMMVSSVARYLTLGASVPKHWANALKRDGQLALDIIRAVQGWHLEESNVPDARDGSVVGAGSQIGSEDEIGGFTAVEGGESEDGDGRDQGQDQGQGKEEEETQDEEDDGTATETEDEGDNKKVNGVGASSKGEVKGKGN